MTARMPAAQGLPDANQADVIGWYEQHMCIVQDVHQLSRFVDLIVRVPTRVGGIVQLVEVKTQDGVIQSHQERLLREWGPLCLAIVRDRRDVAEHVERVQGRFR